MTKPFALDDDGGVTVVGPPVFECFLETAEGPDELQNGGKRAHDD